jgi:hypothetical protein
LQKISKSVKEASPANVIRAVKYHVTPGSNEKIFGDLKRYNGERRPSSFVEDMEMIAMM